MKPEDINVAKEYEVRFEYLDDPSTGWRSCVTAEYVSLKAAMTDATTFSNSRRHRNVVIYEIHKTYTLVKGKWVETKGEGE